ncbi:hypothetical protein ScPMuIL_017655 [Solemya velum]
MVEVMSPPLLLYKLRVTLTQAASHRQLSHKPRVTDNSHTRLTVSTSKLRACRATEEDIRSGPSSASQGNGSCNWDEGSSKTRAKKTTETRSDTNTKTREITLAGKFKASAQRKSSMNTPMVAGTWSFSKAAVLKAAEVIGTNNAPGVDAVEAGINVIEDDESYGPCFVGRGGPTNAAGQSELDAAIMDGSLLNFGAVAALSGEFSRPVSVARRIMENSPHSILTGSGADKFAREQGFSPHDGAKSTTLESPASVVTECGPGHDTLGLLVLDCSGNLCAGVSTSGMAGKHPGRVGDSPLPGCGLYADSTVGAACCSGDGDHILKFCPSYQVVSLIRQGQSVRDACQTVVKEVTERWSSRGLQPFELSVLAMDKHGQVGAATTVSEYQDPLTQTTYGGFPYTMWKPALTEPEIVLQQVV